MSQPAWQLCCPVVITDRSERITLAHGDGGRLMRRLIEGTILSRLQSSRSETGDAAVLPRIDGPLAFTTDSFVVSPLFFPGGDIGRLAVFGTVNDLVVSGAEPLWLSLALIIEEGLPVAVLERVLDSVAEAAREANVRVVTGDTKVVPRGMADGLFLNTAGVGRLLSPAPPGPESLRAGDELVISGPIGRHGIAVMAAREELGLQPSPETDCACLSEAVDALRSAGLFCGGQTDDESDRGVIAMRDATRGGVTSVLHEWASVSGMTLTIEGSAIPVTADVRGAAELLGLDPLHIANEGTMLVAVAAGRGTDAVAALRSAGVSQHASVIGRVTERGIAPVTVRRSLGREQPLDEPSGALLPRIC